MNLKNKNQLQVLKNDSGFSMTELLVAGVISIMLLAASIYIFTYQEDTLHNENDRANIRAKGRHIIKLLVKEMRMIGLGVPPGDGITAISATSISYRANLEDIHTSTPPGGTGTKAATSGANSITVVDGSAFSNNDKIVIYDPSWQTEHWTTVSSATSTSISLNNSFTEDYTYTQNSKLVTVNKYNEVTLALSGTSIVKTVDGSSTTLVTDLATGGLEFDYYGETDPAAVSKIGITVNLLDPDNDNAVIEFKSDVEVRNTG